MEIVERYRDELSDQLETESRLREREIARLQDLIMHNEHVLASLPVTVYDRVEKLTSSLESNLEDKMSKNMENVLTALQHVHDTLLKDIQDYLKDKKEVDPVAGKFEITEGGDVNLVLHKIKLTKAWAILRYIVLALAAGGGVVGAKEVAIQILGMLN